MTCSHLKKLYTLCRDNGLRISSSDLIKIVCTECGEQEVCPSNLMQIESLSDSDGEDADAATTSAAPMALNPSVNSASHSSIEKSE